ncbi:MAG: TetR/AcrR family transcriptional regulator [Clostridia bacterium]
MKINEIREPIQKRSIEKKEKIIKAGFELICEKGYYNTNTAEIAKAASVSTGIVYQYFKDKHDILVEGIKKYASDIFYPMLTVTSNIKIDKNNLDVVLRNMINTFIENHKLSQIAHEEIMAMTHSDKEIAEFFQENEMAMTKNISKILLDNGFDARNLDEKVHIAIHLIDDLCHEIVYHKHKDLDYDIMINLVIENILNLI